MHRTLLNLVLLNLPLQVMRQIIILLSARHQPGRMRKHVIHLLKRHLLRLRQQKPKEDSIRKIANREQVIIPIPDRFHRNRSNLANHSIKRERSHRRDRNTLGPGPRVEDFGWDDP